MSITTAITHFRNAERKLMTSTVTVTRNDGEATFNSTTGAYTQPTQTIYTGDALVRSTMWQGSDVQAGEQEVRLRGLRVKFPADTLILEDDIVTVSDSPDARMIDKTFRVTDVLVDDWQISCTTICEEVVPAEPAGGS